MNPMSRALAQSCIALLSFGLVTAPSHAQVATYPARAVRLIVPFPPGGPTDQLARVIAQQFHDRLKQALVIENRPGATGTIGTALVAKSAPDGYTLLLGANSSHVMSPLLLTPRPYDPVNDFAPVMLLIRYPFFLIASNKLQVQSAGQLIAMARAQPGKLNFATIGQGSGTHFVAELFLQKAGIRATHIPYAGAAAATASIRSGEADFYFDSIASAIPHARAGSVRGIAVTGLARSATIPDTPTMEESGLSGFDAFIWQGIFVPAGTPDPVVRKLNAELGAIMQSPEVIKLVANAGSEIVASSAEAFRATVRADVEMWSRVISERNIRAQ